MALQPYKGANTAQYYVPETTPGVTPTNPAWSILRNTGGIPAVTRDALVSNELDGSRETSDVGGLNAEPYRFSTDGGVTWTEWQTSAVKAVTGLTTGTTYYTRHEVRDAVGNTSPGAIVSVTTS